MWLALVNGKVRLEQGARAALDYELRNAEDVLTGMVFGRLAYLPPALAWEILVGPAEVLAGATPPMPSDFLQDLWPTLQAPEGVDQKRVEPDVVWSAPGFALVTEVKWHSPQNAHQLSNEYLTVRARYGVPHVSVLCLGSVPRRVRAELAGLAPVPSLLALTWREFHASVDSAATAPGLPARHRILLEDVLGILETRGLRRAQFMSDIDLQAPSQSAEASMSKWSVR